MVEHNFEGKYKAWKDLLLVGNDNSPCQGGIEVTSSVAVVGIMSNIRESTEMGLLEDKSICWSILQMLVSRH